MVFIICSLTSAYASGAEKNKSYQLKPVNVVSFQWGNLPVWMPQKKGFFCK